MTLHVLAAVLLHGIEKFSRRPTMLCCSLHTEGTSTIYSPFNASSMLLMVAQVNHWAYPLNPTADVRSRVHLQASVPLYISN